VLYFTRSRYFPAPLASSEAPPPSAGVNIGQRDLTPEEKKVIMDAVGPSLRNPGSAKFRWARFPAVVTEGSVNYCATVDAQSPYAAYNGRQAYIVEAQMSGNRVSSAVIGLVAGRKVVSRTAQSATRPLNRARPECGSHHALMLSGSNRPLLGVPACWILAFV
jgi:hypothetical protein